jgi:hypothetical protein
MAPPGKAGGGIRGGVAQAAWGVGGGRGRRWRWRLGGYGSGEIALDGDIDHLLSAERWRDG